MAGTPETHAAEPFWRRYPVSTALTAALIVAFFACVILFAPGAPFGDDFDISRSVDQAMAAANPWPDLWAQHNEHRPVTTKLIFWAQRAITGAPDYTLLAIIGNLSLAGMFAIFASRALTARGAIGATVLFIATMTFSYTSADSMLWAMTAISNYAVIALALLSFWMLAKGGAGWMLGALGCGLLACISQGNGFVVLALGAVFLLLQKRWLHAGLWLAMLAAFLFAHFATYVSIPGNPGPLAALGRPFEVVLFALIFSGSALSYPLAFTPALYAMMAVSAVLGLALWALILRKLIRSRFRSTDPLLWFSLFLVASGFLAALGRLDGGLIQATTPRYHINSCLLIVSCVLMLVSGDEDEKLSQLAQRAMPWLAAVGLAYVAVSTLILWRMHGFYIEQTQATLAAL